MRHLEAWLTAAGIADGWLFRRVSNDGKVVTPDPMSDRAVARAVTCPVAALQMCLQAAEITAGRVFRSLDRHGNQRATMTGEAVALVVQRRAALAGLDPPNSAPIPCAPGWPPRRPRQGCPRATSSGKPGTGLWPCCAATCGMARCSGTTPAARWGCE